MLSNYQILGAGCGVRVANTHLGVEVGSPQADLPSMYGQFRNPILDIDSRTLESGYLKQMRCSWGRFALRKEVRSQEREAHYLLLAISWMKGARS